MWVLLTIGAALRITHNTLLCHSVDPKLARFELPFIRIVSTRVNILASSLDSEDRVKLYSTLRLEEMRLLWNDLFLLVQFLSCQECHFLLKVLCE